MASQTGATDLETLQRRVDESIGTLKRLFDAASDCMAVVGAQEGRFLAANPAFEDLTGYPFTELQWMHLWELWRPDRMEEARQTFRELLQSGSGTVAEVPLLRKDGAIITVECAARTMRYQGQEALLTIMVDITERKESERRAAQLESLRDLLGTIGAELEVQISSASALAAALRSLGEALPSGFPRRDLCEKAHTAAAAIRDALASLHQQTESALEPPKD